MFHKEQTINKKDTKQKYDLNTYKNICYVLFYNNSIYVILSAEYSMIKTSGIKLPDITVRNSWTRDCVFILGLTADAFKIFGEYTDSISEWMTSGTTETFIAEINSSPLGFAMVTPIITTTQEYKEAILGYELLAIAVKNEYRGLGIGEVLFKACLDRVARSDAYYLSLHTASENIAAQSLFKKFNSHYGQFCPNFYPNGQDAIEMCCFL